MSRKVRCRRAVIVSLTGLDLPRNLSHRRPGRRRGETFKAPRRSQQGLGKPPGVRPVPAPGRAGRAGPRPDRNQFRPPARSGYDWPPHARGSCAGHTGAIFASHVGGVRERRGRGEAGMFMFMEMPCVLLRCAYVHTGGERWAGGGREGRQEGEPEGRPRGAGWASSRAGGAQAVRLHLRDGVPIAFADCSLLPVPSSAIAPFNKLLQVLTQPFSLPSHPPDPPRPLPPYGPGPPRGPGQPTS